MSRRAQSPNDRGTNYGIRKGKVKAKNIHGDTTSLLGDSTDKSQAILFRYDADERMVRLPTVQRIFWLFVSPFGLIGLCFTVSFHLLRFLHVLCSSCQCHPVKVEVGGPGPRDSENKHTLVIGWLGIRIDNRLFVKREEAGKKEAQRDTVKVKWIMERGEGPPAIGCYAGLGPRPEVVV